MQTYLSVSILLFASSVFAVAQDASEEKAVSLKRDDGKKTIRVDIGGELFTEFRYNQLEKPILYPVIGPGGVEMTRNYPMKEGTPGEAKDHPHHTSVWFTHGEVNDSNFWHKGKERIVTKEVVRAEKEGDHVVIETKNDWLSGEGKVVLRDTTKLLIGASGDDRYIDYQITIHATEGDVTFKDTKEGTMGIRSNPKLRLKGEVAAGSAINSEGDKDGDLWGKNAAWVDYWATIEGKEVGFAIFDHKNNPRHPTTWHARDYGLVAANPFGIHDFKKKEKGVGDFTIKSGNSQTFRYKFLFHQGDYKAAKINEKFSAWTGK